MSGKSLLGISLIALLCAGLVLAHGDGTHSGAHPDVKVRVAGFDPVTHVYDMTCDIPPWEPHSNVDPTRFIAYDPIPQGLPPNFRTTEREYQLDLDPENYEELVHSQAMYHMYCEVQNFSAPPGDQNMAAEFHVDLRTHENEGVPNIYVIDSEGPNVRFKCDPPDGVTSYTIDWRMRSREFIDELESLDNQRIVDVTFPEVNSGWDVVCQVNDLDSGTSSKWDMPVELFESGPAYVPTIEGCLVQEPCYLTEDGSIPDGSMTVTTLQPDVDVYINEEFQGTTNGAGVLQINGIFPGLHNIVLQKSGFPEISTLIPIAADTNLAREYDLLNEGDEPDGSVCGNGVQESGEACDDGGSNGACPATCSASCTVNNCGGDGEVCYESVADLPATCNGGTLTTDTMGGCRTLVCENGGDTLQVLACNKPGNNDPQYFEMYKQVAGPGLEICLGDTCISNGGFARSENLPFCVGEPAVCTDGDGDGYSIEGDACGQIDCNDGNAAINPGATEVCDGVDNNCDLFIDEGGICSVCGNGVIDFGEVCDDGNTDNNDGCSSTCQKETIYNSPEPYPGVGADYTMNDTNITFLLDLTNLEIVFVDPMGPHVDGQGHLHWYLDGVKQGRIFDTTYTIPMLPDGSYRIDFTIATNDHREYATDDTIITTGFDLLLGSTCYENVQTVPVSCEGGTVTTDTIVGGCRRVICENGSDNLNVFACNKPGNNDPQYFEMYNQGNTGSGITVCLGDACMSNQGFVRSDDLPFCVGDDGPGPTCTDVDGDGYAIEGDACGAIDCNDGNASINPGATDVCDGVDNNCDLFIDEGGVCSVCGNGVIDFGEFCDDGNADDNDGCSSTCEFETEYNAPEPYPTIDVTYSMNETNVIFDLALQNFNIVYFDPMGPHVDGEGHIHWYLDGVKQGRIYNTTYPIPLPAPGTYDVDFTLATNDHREYAIDGEIIIDSLTMSLGNTCFESVETIPVSCARGSLVTDSWNGCRQLVCEDGADSIQVLACNKPGNNEAQYFEMYRQAVSGTPIEMCLGDTCISNGGFARSDDLPFCTEGTPDTCVPETEVCDGVDNNCNDAVDEGGVCDLCGNGVVDDGEACDTTAPEGFSCSDTCTLVEDVVDMCYEDVENMPVSCAEGDIVVDSYNGCRTIVCENGANSLQVLACNKPGNHDKQYFEMYKQSEAGSPPEICIGGNCLRSQGYVRGDNFPFCTGGASGDSTILTDPLEWIEPSQGLTGVAPSYFHLNVFVPEFTSDVASTDWEVWTADGTEKVWESIGNQFTITYHTHTPDGDFINSAASQGRLNYETEYRVRVRAQDTEGSFGPWAPWRYFTTDQQFTAPPSSPDWSAAPGFRVEEFAQGFDAPVHIDFAPPGMYEDMPDTEEPYFYVTELYGTVKVVYKDGSQAVFADNILNFDPFGPITGGGQMGTVGLLVDDDTGDVYVGTVYIEGEDVKGKIIKFDTNGNGDGYNSMTTIIDNLPSSPSHQMQQLSKGPDGKLYVGMGDALNSANAQSDSTFAGKIIRMNMDGSGAEIYAKGFRNPFGQDWRPGYNVLYSSDNAPDSGDRLLMVEEGGNYGWCCDVSQGRILEVDVSPVDVAFNRGGSNFLPEQTGNLYFAVSGPIYQEGPNNAKHILEVELNDAGTVDSSREFVWYTGEGYGTPTGLDFGPDGLYFTDIYGEPGFVGLGETEASIFRVVQGEEDPCDDCTGPFRAGISIAPWYPKVEGDEIEYIFDCQGIDGSGNYRYDFDFGDGNSVTNTGTDRVFYTYPYADQEYEVSCVAHDQNTGLSAGADMRINPIDFIPET